MLVFVDESGDPGMKLGEGSSPYFVVTTVIFPDRDEANRCDARIDALRTELGLAGHKEFHFNRDGDNIRTAFLEAVSEFDFLHASVVLDKARLGGPGFHYKDSLYKYTVNLAFANIAPRLANAVVIFDRCGGREFANQLRNYVRKRIKEHQEDGQSPLRKVRADKSHTNNLLQLADMVCGAVARSYTSRSKGRSAYRRIVRKSELRVQVWPALR